MATPNIFDKLLEISALATNTTDTSSTAFEFPLDTFYPRNDEHDFGLHVVVDVTALTLAGGTWDVLVQVDSAVGFGSPTTVGQLRVPATGRYRINLDYPTIQKMEADAGFIKVKVDTTGGGGTESITWRAYLVKC